MGSLCSTIMLLSAINVTLLGDSYRREKPVTGNALGLLQPADREAPEASGRVTPVLPNRTCTDLEGSVSCPGPTQGVWAQ